MEGECPLLVAQVLKELMIGNNNTPDDASRMPATVAPAPRRVAPMRITDHWLNARTHSKRAASPTPAKQAPPTAAKRAKK